MGNLTTEQLSVIAILFVILLAVVMLINGGLLLAWALRKEAADAGLKPPLFAPRWSLVHVWVSGQAIIVVLTAIFLLGMIAASVIGGARLESLSGRSGAGYDRTMVWVVLLSLFPQSALMAGIPLWLITRRYGATREEIGLPARPGRQALTIGFVGGLAMIGAAFLMENAVTGLAKLVLSPGQMKALLDLTKSLGNEGFITGVREPAQCALLLLTGGFLVPFAEEVFFRGFLYNCAKRRFGVTAGIVLSGIVFALVHAGPLQVLAIIPMGILLAYLYERTGSLWVPILMHVLNNSLALIFLFLFPQHG